MKRANRMTWMGAALLALGTTVALAGEAGRNTGLPDDPAARPAPEGQPHSYPTGAYPYYPGPYPYPPYPYYTPRLEVGVVPFSPGTMIFVRPHQVTVLRPGWD